MHLKKSIIILITNSAVQIIQYGVMQDILHIFIQKNKIEIHHIRTRVSTL